MQVRVFDILFDDQVCSLVYMQDMTKFSSELTREKAQLYLSIANQCITEELQTPLQAANVLTDELLRNCSEDQQQMLQAVYYASCQMALLISNMQEF